MKKLTAPALLIAIALAGCSAPQEAAQEPASVTASAASSARAATAPQARKMAAVPSRAAAEQKFLDLVDGAPEWPDIKRPTDAQLVKSGHNYCKETAEHGMDMGGYPNMTQRNAMIEKGGMPYYTLQMIILDSARSALC